jgi:hypothetical protein
MVEGGGTGDAECMPPPRTPTRRGHELRTSPYVLPALLGAIGVALLATGQWAGLGWALVAGSAWLFAVTVEAGGAVLPPEKGTAVPDRAHRQRAALSRPLQHPLDRGRGERASRASGVKQPTRHV